MTSFVRPSFAQLASILTVVNAADVKDLDLDPELGILEEEAEAWVGTVDKKISKKIQQSALNMSVLSFSLVGVA